MSSTSPFSTTLPAGVGLDASRLDRLRLILQSEIDRARLPGAVALIARHGKLALFEALGQQDPAGGTPMARDSLFRIYSMTKPIVSVAVMMLLEQGRLLLSDPVSKYLPEYTAQQLAVEHHGSLELHPVTPGATVQDLLR
ncbi:MAG: serine hydrolase domain-containing protein, partial [Rhodoferax sp.]